MGVPAFKTLFKRYGWRTNVRLKDTRIVVDATDELYWFVTNKLSFGQENMDKFGFAIVAFATFFRSFIDMFKAANVTPIIVYNGARLSEAKYGPMVSKTKHLKKSALIRMYMMQSRGGARHLNHKIIPPVVCNVIKQLVNEYQLEAHQSTYEVYPLLVKLANQNDCPVITSHRDFILANVRQGFLLFEELELNPPQHQPKTEIISSHLHKHQLLVSSFRLEQCHSALYCLNVLLRPDFSGRYYRVINSMFRMPPGMSFPQDNTEFVRNPGRRCNLPFNRMVEYVLERWPRELTDPDKVRARFEQHVRLQSEKHDEAMRDYDALWLSFTDSNEDQNIARLLPEHLGQMFGLQEALTKRESTAAFITDILMGQTNIDRLRIEDLDTFKSTYALADPVKLSLMNRAASGQASELNSLTIFDRQRQQMRDRYLRIDPASQPADDFEAPDQVLYDDFRFPSQIATPSNLRAYIRDSRQSADQLMKIALAFKDEHANMIEQIIVLLRLAVYGLKSGFREDYHLPAPRSSRSKSRSKSPPPATKSQTDLQVVASKSKSGSLTDKMKPIESKYRKILPIYLVAVYTSVLYHCFKRDMLKNRMEEHRLLQNIHGGFYAQINLAVQEIDSPKISKPADISNQYYIEIKHLNEMLNSSLGSYMEYNSFYNHPGVVLQLAEYYDAVLVYKICHYMLQCERPNPNLLTIEREDRLYDLIKDYDTMIVD